MGGSSARGGDDGECGGEENLTAQERLLLETVSRNPAVRKLLAPFSRKVKAAIMRNLWVDLALFHSYTARELASRDKSLHLSASGDHVQLKLQHSTKPAKKIASAERLRECLANFLAVQQVLCPRMGAVNSLAASKVNELLRAFPFTDVLEYIETLRIERAGTFVGIVEPCHAAYARCLQEPWFARTSTVTTGGSGGAARDKKRQRTSRSADTEGGAGMPQALVDKCKARKLCVKFNKGTCSETGHTHAFGYKQQRDGPQLSLTHECVVCGSKDHGWHNHA